MVEFLLGRYCATVEEKEIEEGLQIVERQLQDRTVRTGEEELFKARARQKGSIKLIDLVKARLDSWNDYFLVELPSLQLRDVRISDELVHAHERMLTDGFYAEVTLTYDATIAEEKHGRPFAIESLRAIQLSKADVLSILHRGRQHFTTEEWRDFLIRSIGLEPAALSNRAKNVVLLRMVPFVESNFNLVELGPRGTGKSHLFQQISPYSHLISGGKATVAKMFVNNATGQRGLVCLYDVVCFDEVSGISFDQKEQQKRCLKTEFRNTHFSYFMGVEGIEQFVSTPELHSDEAIDTDPLPPGQVWAISPGGQDAAPALYRIEATVGPGSGVKILNAPVPPAFRESVRYGEQNLYTRARELVGDRDPRSHEFSIQLRAMDNDRSGQGLGLPVLIALCGGLIERSVKGGLIIVGALNLGGSIEIIPNPVAIAELAIEKGATQLLMPVSSRRQLFDLPDELATKITIEFYADAVDALLKAILT